MIWAIGFLILLVALLIPILAIVLDSPAVRQVFERRAGSATREIQELAEKVRLLEDQIEDLSRSLESLKEETEFLQRLLENPEQRPAQRSLPTSSS
jgi:predicted  nucleic acid-binding Zn-ribbon protein